MVDKATTADWCVFGRSVCGAAHQRAQLPKQDAIGWAQQSDTELWLTLAVSDGHGSAKSFRSDRGARFAVEAATEALQQLRPLYDQLWEREDAAASLSAIKRLAEERVPQQLEYAWKQRVDTDLHAEDLSEEEFARMLAHEVAQVRKAVADNRFLAYGATILAALVTEAFIIYLQLGDGDILTVSEQGEVARPVPRDERLFANETTSLSAKAVSSRRRPRPRNWMGAWRDVQVVFQALTAGQPPALILLATDGYANSFQDESAFRKVGSDILEMICQRGPEAVEERLESWLHDASHAGSGDDITLGVICSMAAVHRRQAGRPADPAQGARRGGRPQIQSKLNQLRL